MAPAAFGSRSVPRAWRSCAGREVEPDARSRRARRARPTTARRRSPARASRSRPRRRARASSDSGRRHAPHAAACARGRRRALPGTRRRRRPRTRGCARRGRAHGGDATPGRDASSMRAATRWLRSRPVHRNVCVVGVGLSDGPVTPDLTGTMLEAQAFRRALDDAGLEPSRHRRARERRLRRHARGAARRVPRAHAALARVDARRRVELRVPDHARVPRDPGRRRRHGRDRLRQQPAVGVRAARSAPVAAAAARRRHGDAAADGVRVPDRASRSSVRTRWPRSGTCTSTARRPSSSRRSRCRRASTPARNPNAMYRDPITVDDVLASKLVADPLHKLDCCVISDGGCCIILTTEERARDLAAPPVYVRGAAGGTTHHSIQAMADMTRDRGRGERPEGVRGGRDHAGRRRHVRDVRLVHLHGARRARGPRVRAEGRRRRRSSPTATCGSAARCRPTPTAAACRRRIPGMRGLFLLCEATRQLRGEAGDAQVAGRRDRGRARQRRLAVDAGHGRARNGAAHDLVHVARIRHARLERDPEVPAGRRRRRTTASSGKARAAASCASSTARRAASTSTTRACSARTADATRSSG